MKRIILLIAVFLPLFLAGQQSIIIDHNCLDLDDIPDEYIESAKANLWIGYGHTSHGSQLTSGMSALAKYFDDGTYDWSHDGGPGELHLFEGEGGYLSGDCGTVGWDYETREYLDDFPGCNVIIWSWCGQVNDVDLPSHYFGPMEQLELDYPDVQFVYMTGHLEGLGPDGTLFLANQQIRDYCIENNKILYDFTDIEKYSPDADTNYQDYWATDECNYNPPGGGTANWANNWLAANPGHELTQISQLCGTCAHSVSLNCTKKGIATWFLWARLAGWEGPASNSYGVSIHTDGTSADNSAMLDVKSSDRGILIPRVTLDDASTTSPISSPATGLLIYNENGTEPIGFYHWDDSEWQKLFDANGDDKDWILSGNNMYSAVSGNVGVGTSTPAFNFHILDGAPTLLIEASEEADASLLFRDYQDASTQNFDITFSAADENLYISSDETQAMTITPDATVMIHNEIEYVGNNGNGSGANGMIQKNASAGRDELQFYAGGDAYTTNSNGAGMHLYGNYDGEHAGNIAFLTGNSGAGNGRMIIAGGGGPGPLGRDLTDTRITIGNSIWNWVDDEDDVGLLNLKDPSGTPAIYIQGASSSEGEIAIANGESFNVGQWNGSSFSSTLEIDGSGDVGIGTTTPTALLSVNGSANKPGGDNWTAFSDIRSKKNIDNYDRGLAELIQLHPVSYKYKKEFNWGDKTYVGLIAQELEEVVPSMVTEIEVQNITDFKEIDPNELTYMLINALKELKDENNILKARLAALEAE